MEYLDIITLEQAKNHLRIDCDFTEDDEAIERMIKSALEYVETYTNHILRRRDITYYRNECDKRIKVYDHPINEFPDNITMHFALRHEFVSKKITLDVGYENKQDIPSGLIDSALMIIDNWYYQHEKEESHSVIPEGAKDVLFIYRRHIIS